MIVHKKNDGTYVPYALAGTALSFRNGLLTVDLSEYERDWPVQLDIGEDETGALVLGPPFSYIAQIDICARTSTIEVGPADDFGFPKLKKVAAPLDTDKVTLTLWAQEV